MGLIHIAGEGGVPPGLAVVGAEPVRRVGQHRRAGRARQGQKQQNNQRRPQRHAPDGMLLLLCIVQGILHAMLEALRHVAVDLALQLTLLHFSCTSSNKSERRMASLPRESRDLTVPAGKCSMPAISLTE